MIVVYPSPPASDLEIVIKISGSDLTDLKILLDRALNCAPNEFPNWLSFQDKLEKFLAGA